MYYLLWGRFMADKRMVSIKFTPDQYKRLKEMAEDEAISVSDIVRMAVKWHLKKLKAEAI